MTQQEIMEKLQAPFPLEDIEFRVGSTTKDKAKGLALAYVTNRAIQARLDEVFGPFGWQNQFREWKNNSQICGISALWEGQWITKWDGADDSNTEAVKGGLSDSMKRAAVQWGIGRYLYKLDGQWCKIRQQGSSYVLDEQPKLPEWALPKGYKQPAQQKPVTIENKPVAGLATDEQRRKLFATAKEAGASAEDIKALIAAEPFNLDSTSKLTKQQASQLIDYYTKQKQAQGATA